MQVSGEHTDIQQIITQKRASKQEVEISRLAKNIVGGFVS